MALAAWLCRLSESRRLIWRLHSCIWLKQGEDCANCFHVASNLFDGSLNGCGGADGLSVGQGAPVHADFDSTAWAGLSTGRYVCGSCGVSAPGGGKPDSEEWAGGGFR